MPSNPRSSRKTAAAESKRRAAKFARPELTTPWQRFTRNVFVRVIAAVVLVGGTGFLTYTAVTTSY